MIVTDQVQTYCPDPIYLVKRSSDHVAYVGEFELFRPPDGVWCHKLGIIMDQSMAPGHTADSDYATQVANYDIQAEIHFDLDGKTITNYPCTFAGSKSSNNPMRACLFPNTNSAAGINNDSIQLFDWGNTANTFLLPRRIVSACDRVTLYVKYLRVSSIGDGWRGYFSLMSANKLF